MSLGLCFLSGSFGAVLWCLVNKKSDFRTEKDQLGEMQIPASAYWGIQTMRVQESFAPSALKPHPQLIDAAVVIKKVAALVNAEDGRLNSEVSKGIVQSADEVLNGQWRDEFIVDPFQAGCGWAYNVNVNEVLANRAAEILGGQVGKYTLVHPNDHVNMLQAAGDVFQSAMRIAILTEHKELEHVLLDLERLLRRKALEFNRIVKIARPGLRDSVPITLGQEFNAYGSAIEHCCRRLADASHGLQELNIGAGPAGSGIAADPVYVSKMIERLSHFTGLHLRNGDDFFRLSQSAADFLSFSSSMRELAVELARISGDLRLLSSGPHTGIAEISLPAIFVQPHLLAPGMVPATAPPALPECVTMVAYQVIGNDTAVMLAAQAGQLDANIMTPLISHNILQSITLLKQALSPFNRHCVAGITASSSRCKELLELTESPLLALAAHLGVARAQELDEEARTTGKSLRNLIIEQQLIPGTELDKILSCLDLCQPGSWDSTTGSGSGQLPT